MAKVQGPLLSLDASGKIADAIVFFPWKGRHVVRQWLKPANPKRPDQGDIRQILGGLGRATSPIHTTSDFAKEVRLYMDEGQTWVSAIVKYMMKNVVTDGPTWDAIYTEKMEHPSQALFDTAAVALNLQPFTVTYRGCANIAPPGFQLYLIAKFATNWELLGTKGFQREPYTTALFDWVVGTIDLLVGEFVAA